jgi:hypothetical protein
LIILINSRISQKQVADTKLIEDNKKVDKKTKEEKRNALTESKLNKMYEKK